MKAWRDAHPEYGPAYRKAHRAERLIYYKKYYKLNREKRIAFGKNSRKTHVEEIRQYHRTAAGRFLNLKRAAKQRGIAIHLTLEEYVQLVGGGICCYCGAPLPETGSGLDRKNSSGDYSAENCVPAGAACNSIRGEDLIAHDEMFEVIKFLRLLRRKNAA